MKSIKSSEYNPADNYDYPEFIAVSGKEDRTPDEGFDNLEEAKARADKIGGFVYQMINGEGVEIYSANESIIETTESEKATEIKEEFSENAYLQLINETTPVPMEFHGRYYNSAEEWKEHDPVAFSESYMAWIDGNEKDGIDTGDDGYEANTKGVPKGIPSELLEQRHEEEKEKSGVPDNWTLGDGQKVKQWDEDEAQQGESKATEVSAEEEEVANDLWIALGEGGLLGDYIGGGGFDFDITMPSWVSDPEVDMSSIGWDELTATDKQNVVNHFGGVEGMKEKLCDEGWDNYCEPEEYAWESKATEGSIEWTEVDERGLKVIDTGSTYETEDGDTIIWSSFDAEQAQRRLNQIVSNQSFMGESKASETFYDQALWLAKAKLEQNGLDIVGALPDIIRNTRTSTGRDFDEAELNRAIEDAIVIYKDMLVTGMSMWGDRNTKASELAPTIGDMKYDNEPMRFGDGHGVSEDPLYPESTKKEETKLDTEEDIDEFIKKEADEIVGALAVNDELEGIKDTYGSSPNADPTTTPLEDHSGTDDSSDIQTDISDDQGTSDVQEDTVEESFGDCGCKDTKKARTTWESAKEGDKQYWLRDMGEDEGYSYYHFEHLPKRVGESLVDKFKIEQSEDRGWSKIPALERANLLKKLGFPPRDAELVANLEYPQLSESLKKDVNDAVGVKKRAEESKREKPDEQLAFENDLYSNMYDGYLKRRGERVDSKKNDKF